MARHDAKEGKLSALPTLQIQAELGEGHCNIIQAREVCLRH